MGERKVRIAARRSGCIIKVGLVLLGGGGEKQKALLRRAERKLSTERGGRAASQTVTVQDGGVHYRGGGGARAPKAVYNQTMWEILNFENILGPVKRAEKRGRGHYSKV